MRQRATNGGSGKVSSQPPLRAAKFFLGAVAAQHHLYSLIGQPPTQVSEAEIREHVRAAIAMFLAADSSD